MSSRASIRALGERCGYCAWVSGSEMKLERRLMQSVVLMLVSPYRPRALADSCKKNMPGKLFLVFASVIVPLVCKYVLCTKWNRNISLI